MLKLMPLNVGFAALSLCAMAFLSSSGQAASDTGVIDLQTGGGVATWALNESALQPLGIRLVVDESTRSRFEPGLGGRYASLQTHVSESTGLIAILDGSHLSGLRGGWIELHDGPILALPGVSLDLRHARIRPAAPPSLALVIGDDSTAKVWATLDHPHYGIAEDRRSLWINHADLHVGTALAVALGHPEWTGTVIGHIDLSLPIKHTRAAPLAQRDVRTECPLMWPSPEKKVDLLMTYLANDPELGGLPDSIAFMRCGIPSLEAPHTPCSPTSENGLVVFAPDAALKNVGTAAIAWHPMFSGNHAPYGNDQHPYLFWNLYRMDAQGSIRQIGRSGAKHAYYADNFGCICPHGLAAYPGCQETYAAGTNDVLAFLGPRSEIIPATGQWGRCGSVFDPTCLGRPSPTAPREDDGYEQRMTVLEADLLPNRNPLATYIFEYGYIVRDDIDLENSIAHRFVTPAKAIMPNGSVRWSLTPASFDNGPAINTWVAPRQSPPGTMNTWVVTPDGHLRVAVRTKALDEGRTRYEYAVMNEDFAVATTTGAEPDLRIRSSRGVDRFTVPLPYGTTITDLSFTDADTIQDNDWVSRVDETTVSWSAPEKGSLTWGTLYTFGFTTTAKPKKGAALVGVSLGSSRAIRAETLMPTPP